MKLRGRAPILAVIALALVLRGAYFLTYSGRSDFRVPMLDSEWFHEQAVAMLGGDWSAPEATFRGPLYPLFLSGVYALFGPDPASARLVQLLLGALTVLLIARLGRRLFGPEAGLLAGLLAALDWILIYHEGELLIESILPLLAVLMLLALLRAKHAPSIPNALLSGALVALFAVARPNVLLFLPVAALWVGWGRARACLAVLAGAGILLAPVVARNRAVTGEWVLVSTQGGVNFYIGNNRSADGMHAAFPGLASWENADVARLTAARMGRVPTENEISRYWFHEGLREIAADPPRFAAGIARKCAYLMSSHEIANDRDLVVYRRENGVLSLPLLSFGVLLPLALVGLVFGGVGERGTKLLVLYLAFYGLSIVLFFVCARFRVPLLVALFPPAARGLLVLARGVRRRSARALAAPLVLLAASTAVVSADPLRIRISAEGQEAFHRGNVEARLGNASAAIEAYRAALEKAPRFAAARYHLGVVLLGEGREEEGVRELSLAMDLDPRNPRIPVSLGEHLEARGERGRAEELYRRAVASDPYFAEAQLGLGALLAEEGRLGEAEPLLRRALELSPGDPAALLDLGKLLGSTGREGEAEGILRRLTESGSAGRDAWFEYGGLLARRGRFPEAATAFREAIRLDPRSIASYMNLSFALREGGDRAGAAEALREVLALDPGNEVARRRLEEVGP